MSHQAAVYQWTRQIARQFPPLRASQAKVLAAFRRRQEERVCATPLAGEAWQERDLYAGAGRIRIGRHGRGSKRTESGGAGFSLRRAP